MPDLRDEFEALERIARHISSPSRKVSCVSLFGSPEVAEIHSLFIHHDSGSKPRPLLRNAKKTKFVGFERSLSVLPVLNSAHISEIRNSVVRRHSVDMVNARIRPFPMHIEPGKPMGEVALSIQLYSQIATSCRGACLAANLKMTNAFAPQKDASFRVIGKHLKESFVGDECASRGHSKVLFQRCLRPIRRSQSLASSRHMRSVFTRKVAGQSSGCAAAIRAREGKGGAG